MRSVLYCACFYASKALHSVSTGSLIIWPQTEPDNSSGFRIKGLDHAYDGNIRLFKRLWIRKKQQAIILARRIHETNHSRLFANS